MRHGYVVVAGATQRQADERVADARARLSVITSSDGEPPAHHMQ